jgi:hypothetical protein
VPFLTEFARQHNLLQPKLSEVLLGSRKFHRGWHLETTEKKKAVYVRSPDNEVFEIKPGERPSFCKSKNLTPSLMWKVITGKASHHKGWTLA